MTDWINGVCDRVDRLAARDPYSQELEEKRKALEPLRDKVLAMLPEADRDVLTEYEFLISELAYQKTQTAYRLGCAEIVNP